MLLCQVDDGCFFLPLPLLNPLEKRWVEGKGLDLSLSKNSADLKVGRIRPKFAGEAEVLQKPKKNETFGD